MRIFIAILFGSAWAYWQPQTVLWLKPVLKPAFAVTMFFVGTLVQRKQLEAFAAAPLRPLLGLATQYTVMPLTAAAISLLFDDPLLRTGIVLVGCMPGAMASNVMTALLGGDLVLSVIITTLATLGAPLIVAFWLPILAGHQMDLPVSGLAWDATWMVAGPVATGIVLRQFIPNVPRWWDKVATAAASAAIVAIVLVVVAANQPRLATLGLSVAAAMIGLNLLGYGLGFSVATLARWPAAQRRTLVVEVGMQNAGLGSVLALSHLGEAGAVPSAFYTALCVITAAVAIPIVARKRMKAEAVPPAQPAV